MTFSELDLDVLDTSESYSNVHMINKKDALIEMRDIHPLYFLKAENT